MHAVIIAGPIAFDQADRPVIAAADQRLVKIHEASGVRFHSRHPGVKRACGHDLHSAMMLGAVLKLKADEQQLAGRVRILFQPAEEIVHGARQFITAGVLDQVQTIFGMHNEPTLPVGIFATRGGAFYANADKFIIRVTGKGAHAAHPEQGVDSIVIASQIMQALQGLTSLDSLILSPPLKVFSDDNKTLWVWPPANMMRRSLTLPSPKRAKRSLISLPTAPITTHLR